MTMNMWGLLISYVYVFAVIFGGETLRKWRDYPTEFTRKFVHVGVGMWIVGTVLLFDSRWWAVIPPFSFILLNYVSYRVSLFKSVETGEKENLGTVYFPLSFCILLLLLWEQPALLVASLMTMTWGDALAALVGRRWGSHTFRIGAVTRSLEGSLAMLGATWLAVTFSLWAFQGDLAMAAAQGLWTALFATLIEAITPWHLDNLSVPLLSGLALAILN